MAALKEIIDICGYTSEDLPEWQKLIQNYILHILTRQIAAMVSCAGQPVTILDMPPRHEHHAAVIRLIAVFKLAKAVLLLLIGLGARNLVHRDVQAFAIEVIKHIHGDPNGHHFRMIVSKLANVSPARLKLLGVAAFSYSILYFIEGTGLLLAMRWAEWMAVITTSGFIPLELYEVHKEFHWVRFVVTLLNIAIVVYLVRELMRLRAIKTGSVAAETPSLELPS